MQQARHQRGFLDDLLSEIKSRLAVRVPTEWEHVHSKAALERAWGQIQGRTGESSVQPSSFARWELKDYLKLLARSKGKRETDGIIKLGGSNNPMSLVLDWVSYAEEHHRLKDQKDPEAPALLEAMCLACGLFLFELSSKRDTELEDHFESLNPAVTLVDDEAASDLVEDAIKQVLASVHAKVSYYVERQHGKDALRWANQQLEYPADENERSWEEWDITSLKNLFKSTRGNKPGQSPGEAIQIENPVVWICWRTVVMLRNKASHKGMVSAEPYPGYYRFGVAACGAFLEHLGYREECAHVRSESNELFGAVMPTTTSSQNGMKLALVAAFFVITIVAAVFATLYFVQLNQQAAPAQPLPPARISSGDESVTPSVTTVSKVPPAPTAPVSSTTAAIEPVEPLEKPERTFVGVPEGFLESLGDEEREWVYSSGSARFNHELMLHWEPCEAVAKMSPSNREVMVGTVKQLEGGGLPLRACTFCYGIELSRRLQEVGDRDGDNRIEEDLTP